jgi:hypothetical protein
MYKNQANNQKKKNISKLSMMYFFGKLEAIVFEIFSLFEGYYSLIFVVDLKKIPINL